MEQTFLQHAVVIVAWNLLFQSLKLCFQPPSKLSDLLILILCDLVEILLESINGPLFPEPVFHLVQQGFHALFKPHRCSELLHFTPYRLYDRNSDSSHSAALQSLLHLPDPLLAGGLILGYWIRPQKWW